MSQGVPVEYLMLRGIFMPPGVTPDQVAFYTDLFKKVAALPEWKEFMEKGAFKQTMLTGAASRNGSPRTSSSIANSMKEAGFLAQ